MGTFCVICKGSPEPLHEAIGRLGDVSTFGSYAPLSPLCEEEGGMRHATLDGQ
jgi:hypothetical protein